MIAAHGNSLRGIVKHLDIMSNDAIMALNLPTGIPFVYELDENMKPVKPMQVNKSTIVAIQFKLIDPWYHYDLYVFFFFSFWVMKKLLQKLWQLLPPKERQNRSLLPNNSYLLSIWLGTGMLMISIKILLCGNIYQHNKNCSREIVQYLSMNYVWYYPDIRPLHLLANSIIW